jgi:hypothetical protein
MRWADEQCDAQSWRHFAFEQHRTTNRINNAATITMSGGTIGFSGNITEASSPAPAR